MLSICFYPYLPKTREQKDNFSRQNLKKVNQTLVVSMHLSGIWKFGPVPPGGCLLIKLQWEGSWKVLGHHGPISHCISTLILRTSFNTTWKKVFVMNLSFLTDSLNPYLYPWNNSARSNKVLFDASLVHCQSLNFNIISEFSEFF